MLLPWHSSNSQLGFKRVPLHPRGIWYLCVKIEEASDRNFQIMGQASRHFASGKGGYVNY